MRQISTIQYARDLLEEIIQDAVDEDGYEMFMHELEEWSYRAARRGNHGTSRYYEAVRLWLMIFYER